MDDAKTRQMLEILGDRFLTGTSKKAADAPKSDDAKNAKQPPADDTASNADDQADPKAIVRRDAVRDALDGPRPIRLSPKLRQAMPDPPVQAFTQQPTSSHAAPTTASLRLTTDEGDEGDRQPAARPAAHVEAVFLGNLPGFGGPWLTQYAHYLSVHLQPDVPGIVAVLRVDDEAIDIELVGPHQMKLAVPEVLADPQSLGLERTLWELTRSATFHTKAFVLHLPTPIAPAFLEMAGGVNRWTLVSGADDAAIVAAYRMLKQLVESFGHDERHVGLMVMGADPSRSREATDKLSDTAGNHLGASVELVGSRKQMVPITLKQIASFSDPLGRWPIVRSFLHELVAHSTSEPWSWTGQAQGVTDVVPSQDFSDTEDVADIFESVEQPSAPDTADDELLDDAPQFDSVHADVSPVIGSADDETLAEAQDQTLSGDSMSEADTLADDRGDDDDDVAAVNTSVPASIGTDVPADAMAFDDEPMGDHSEPSRDDTITADDTPTGNNEVGDLSDVLRAQYEREARRTAPPRKPTPPTTPAREPRPQPQPSHAKPSTQPPASNDIAADEPDLASFLDVGPNAGGIILQAKRPGHARTRILLDQSGTLHLLHRHQPDAGDVVESLRAAVLELIDTRHWVSEHIELLQLTQRQCRFDLDAEPVLHLFTPDAKLAVSLADSIGAYVKLHLLQRVTVGRDSVWTCTALN